jgi:hypothetical protein
MPFIDSAIRSTVEDQLEDLIAAKGLNYTDPDHLHSIVDSLQVTYIDCDQNGSNLNGVTTTLDRKTQVLGSLLIRCALNCAEANISRPGTAIISYNKGLEYTFNIIADHVVMPNDYAFDI